MHRSRAVPLTLALLFGAGFARAEGKLGVFDAWIRQAPPGATMMAGYATLKNTGDMPVTVLTAIIVPMVLAPHGQGLELTWRNPQLVAALFAIAVCATTRHQLLTILLGLVAFFGWQFVWGISL